MYIQFAVYPRKSPGAAPQRLASLFKLVQPSSTWSEMKTNKFNSQACQQAVSVSTSLGNKIRFHTYLMCNTFKLKLNTFKWTELFI